MFQPVVESRIIPPNQPDNPRPLSTRGEPRPAGSRERHRGGGRNRIRRRARRVAVSLSARPTPQLPTEGRPYPSTPRPPSRPHVGTPAKVGGAEVGAVPCLHSTCVWDSNPALVRNRLSAQGLRRFRRNRLRRWIGRAFDSELEEFPESRAFLMGRKVWRRGWDSNPRAGYPTRRFRGAPVTTTSVPLLVACDFQL